ncbi:claudin-15-like protein [Lates japonicus]|uniref:Claudin-15-like protein n=1 Tax=Lates japonicus TaxID=270547 RepID=A0AAD3MCI9_LATJO|nr:claudin-15-like protein [Lates japonicus]
MNAIVEAFAFFLGFLGWLMVGIALPNRYWKVSTVDGYIQASRALMIAAIVFGTFGLVATLAGMKCSKIGGENYILKGRVAAIGGVFFLLQGICTLIAVSWYAANITQQFFDQFYPGTKYEIGEGLYIGWSSAVLAICGGKLMCLQSQKTCNE